MPLWVSVFSLRIRVLQLAAGLIFLKHRPGQVCPLTHPELQVEVCHTLQISAWLTYHIPTSLLHSFPQLPVPLRALIYAIPFAPNTLSPGLLAPILSPNVNYPLQEAPSSLMPLTQDGQVYFRFPLKNDLALKGDITLEEVKWQSTQSMWGITGSGLKLT